MLCRYAPIRCLTDATLDSKHVNQGHGSGGWGTGSGRVMLARPRASALQAASMSGSGTHRESTGLTGLPAERWLYHVHVQSCCEDILIIAPSARVAADH